MRSSSVLCYLDFRSQILIPFSFFNYLATTMPGRTLSRRDVVVVGAGNRRPIPLHLAVGLHSNVS